MRSLNLNGGQLNLHFLRFVKGFFLGRVRGILLHLHLLGKLLLIEAHTLLAHIKIAFSTIVKLT